MAAIGGKAAENAASYAAANPQPASYDPPVYGRFVPQISPTPAVPAPVAVVAAPVVTAVKVATVEMLQMQQETLPEELMTNLIFENIGGQELLSVTRQDIVNSPRVIYQPIKNLNGIAIENNSSNIIPMFESSNNHFDNFTIKLDGYVDKDFSEDDTSHIYLDNDAGQIIINLVNVKPNQQVEVEILGSVTSFDDTIYTGV